MAGQCQALYLSDKQRCTQDAIHANGLFCPFHARQAYSLYKGYKQRNAQLDRLAEHPPAYLMTKSLRNVDFKDLEDEVALNELHSHLYQRHALLDRVIRARQLHHSRFYALELDYGHQNHINQLASQKNAVLRALGRLVRRIIELSYKKQEWFKWIAELEAEAEKQHEAEKKKVKREAALFSRHRAEAEARAQAARHRKEEQQQQEFLQKAWEERQNLEESYDEQWDPIEDMIHDQRERYIDMLRYFLWQDSVCDLEMPKEQDSKDGESINVRPEATGRTKNPSPAVSKSMASGETKSHKDKPADTQETSGQDERHVETKSKMQQRLKQSQLNQAVGATQSYSNASEPTSPSSLDDEEIEALLEEICEIRQLLFCRLLIARPALLPSAIRANGIDEFLTDQQVPSADLRDICLQMERPSLQELRDACADLGRINEEGEDEDAPNPSKPPKAQLFPLRSALPKSYQTKREKAIIARREKEPVSTGGIVNFGDIDDQKQYRIRKVRIKVCGRYIYNHPSEKAMSRGGWLQFSVLAKGCTLFDAVKLCRSWEEFFELAILTRYNYFPTSNWIDFIGDQTRQQLIHLVSGTAHEFIWTLDLTVSQ
jgi:hypothetical protein